MDEFNNPIKDKRKTTSGKGGIATDMNAMVDLAFLLLTFFMLTTTMVRPKVLEMIMPVPDKEEELSKGQTLKESRALTLVPFPEGKLYYYKGFSEAVFLEAGQAFEDIATVLNQHALSQEEPIVIIKPHPESHFEQVVDLIDAVHLAKIQRYAFDQYGEKEETLARDKGVNYQQ
jgi:biopolymer transport protein ExbD